MSHHCLPLRLKSTAATTLDVQAPSSSSEPMPRPIVIQPTAHPQPPFSYSAQLPISKPARTAKESQPCPPSSPPPSPVRRRLSKRPLSFPRLTSRLSLPLFTSSPEPASPASLANTVSPVGPLIPASLANTVSPVGPLSPAGLVPLSLSSRGPMPSSEPVFDGSALALPPSKRGQIDSLGSGPGLLTDDDADLQQRLASYWREREATLNKESEAAFDFNCRQNATPAEALANDVLLRLKGLDQASVFDAAAKRVGYGHQEHPAFAGDHYLANVELVEQTRLLQVARKMPKGAHLHIHYNACLKPNVLLQVAEGMDRMFITSDLSLADRANYFLCEIQFSILPPEKERPGNLFSPDYQPRQTMRFSDFLHDFPAVAVGKGAMQWLEEKLVFGVEETYNMAQTSFGAWERFNGRTRMMKGLFNYVTAYRKYTEWFLQDLLADNIQYAEIRPNFMMTNQLWNDEGTQLVDNAGIVKIIIDECEAFQARLAANPGPAKPFEGIKIIYCTPRIFPAELVRGALAECIEFKLRWPEYIAGFDLVGEEAKGRPLKYFAREFAEFQMLCDKKGLEIPFLFHCGETLDVGSEVDGNLVDALVLKSKRIGHGFALPRHPHVMAAMKARGVCVEVCPISNEILGLTPRIGGHAVYSLLANNVPCTVNSDNGTLFRSSLSHDFYQVLIGQHNMGLFGWRQLAEWSLQHACLSPPALAAARQRWLSAWSDFVVWLLETHGGQFPDLAARQAAVLGDIRAQRQVAAKPSRWEAK